MKNEVCSYKASDVDAWNVLMCGNFVFKNGTPPTF